LFSVASRETKDFYERVFQGGFALVYLKPSPKLPNSEKGRLASRKEINGLFSMLNKG
jgi:hypothetical protein